MKTINMIIQGRNVTWPGGSSGPATLRTIKVTPVVEENPGNFQDPTPWAYTVYDRRHYSGQTSFYKTSTGQLTSWKVGAKDSSLPTSSYFPWTEVRSSVYNGALGRLNDKVRGNVDLSVDVAEGRKTMKMIKDITKVFRRLRSVSPKAFASGYLEYRYGWRPLMQTAYESADRLINYTTRKLFRLRGRYTRSLQRDYTAPRGIDGRTWTCVGQGRGKASCCIVVDIEMPSLDIAKWTSLNPMTLAWELVPYSFVVDWVFDVGSYLRNLETTAYYGSGFKGGYISELLVYDAEERTCAGDKIVESQDTTVVIGGMDATLRQREFSRQRLYSYPLPHRPRLKVDLGASQVLAGIALVVQKMKR